MKNLSRSDMIFVGLQEIAALFMGIFSGIALCYWLLLFIPPVLRGIIGFLIGWNFISDIPLYFVHRTIGFDKD